MIRFVPCLLFLDQCQGLSNLAHVREQNTSLTVLQTDVDALAVDSSSRLTLAASQQQKPTKTSTMYRSLSDDFNVVLRSFSVVAVAELFDKTWFVALICAPLMAFGCRQHFHDLGLGLHVFLPVCASSAFGKSKRHCTKDFRHRGRETELNPQPTGGCNSHLRPDDGSSVLKSWSRPDAGAGPGRPGVSSVGGVVWCSTSLCTKIGCWLPCATMASNKHSTAQGELHVGGVP